ncbi:MAG: sugar porter family MFS transporter [Burkholderiales bacterium]|nr:sugar porter family MFS transporter [Burkholderiales bacterium]
MFYVILSSTIASIAGLLFGYDTGVISGALIFLKKDFIINPTQEGMIVSILLFGAAIGALSGGKIADRIGRKKILIIVGVLCTMGTLGLAQAKTLNEIYLFRFILGLPIGVGSFAAPSYISEIAPKSSRGMLVSFFQLAIVIGILLTYIGNYYFSTLTNAWRHMFLFGLIPTIIFLFGLFLLPESPRWLIEKGMDKEAIKILTKLRSNVSLDEYHEIKLTVKKENSQKLNWDHLFNKTNLPVLYIASIIMFFQQFSGIDAIIYYAPQIFMQTGLELNSSMLSTVSIGIVNLISTIMGLIVLDKIGRRKLMLYGSIIMAVALAFVMLSLSIPQLKYFGIIGILTYIFAFATSTGVVGWLIVSEIFPLRVRGRGTSVAITTFWLFNISISFTFPILIKIIGIRYIFGFFALTCVASFIYYLYYLPETNGVSLETIEKNLINGEKSRHLGTV